MTRQVKMIGIVGGMSWASTITYYRMINEETIRITNGRRCGSVRIVSFDSSEIEQLIKTNSWSALADRIEDATNVLVGMGCEIIVVASNTAHIAFECCPDRLHDRTMHIADAIVDQLVAIGTTRPGFVGTSATLSGLARGRFANKMGRAPVIPAAEMWTRLDEIVFERLCRGVVCDADKMTIEALLDELRNRGAEHIVLGCTEIGLLFSREEKSQLRLIDSAEVHAAVAARIAIDGVGARLPG